MPCTIKLIDPETGKKKTYRQEKVGGLNLRTGISIKTRAEKGEIDELETLDEMIALIAKVFEGHPVVTEDSIWQLDASDIEDTVADCFWQILGKDPKQMKDLQKRAMEVQMKQAIKELEKMEQA
ncbi:phage tail assembly chaperone G [Terribacillus sp. 7520-G]|uniref:phage tail assembly chaperone G n=1 Tax=Terribacillus sp. 7520-G TaxID=2025389 RepID=UPI000BA4ED96|nr:hypothetical protein [Terribacillus sp. 7520-G]PAD39818.1 hypothetical protein CHH53_04040 [Terribacillus sp. 7520-G]